MINNDLILDDQLQDEPLVDDSDSDNIIISDPLLETDTDPSKTVYSVEFIKEGLCAKDTETMTVVEFDTCVNYVSYQTTIDYLSLFFGLLLGVIMAKAVSDGWA